jgi:hypothetical protein
MGNTAGHFWFSEVMVWLYILFFALNFRSRPMQVLKRGSRRPRRACLRGCPFQCWFCTISNVHGRKSRFKEALAAPDRWTHSDVAIAAADANEFEMLDLYHPTSGGKTVLAHKFRHEAIRGAAPALS